MMKQVLIGIGVGLTSFLLYASATQFTALALVLFYLAPLPLLLATLGWGRSVGLVAGTTALAGVSVVVSAIAGLAFLATVAAPAVFLAHLAGLSQPLSAPTTGTQPEKDKPALAWYPLGRLVLWAVAWGITTSAIALVMFTSGPDELATKIRPLLETFFSAQPLPLEGDTALSPPDPATLDAFAALMARLLFPGMAIIWLLTMLGNLWMAGRVLLRSKRLPRPWPALREIHLPVPTAIAFFVAVVACILPGMLGQIALIAAAGLGTALILLGLAVVHDVTGAVGARTMILVALYSALVIFGWPALALVALGLAEIFFSLRARVRAKRPPSLGST
ncbi:MAG: hypothetical protein ACTSY1_08035 [Alphaproteobacteria bacterium]